MLPLRLSSHVWQVSSSSSPPSRSTSGISHRPHHEATGAIHKMECLSRECGMPRLSSNITDERPAQHSLQIAERNEATARTDRVQHGKNTQLEKV